MVNCLWQLICPLSFFLKAVGLIPMCASVLTIKLAGNRVRCEEPSRLHRLPAGLQWKQLCAPLTIESHAA